MTKEEREKRGLVGKKVFTSEDGEKFEIDFEDEESYTFTGRDYLEMCKKVKPGVRYYSETGELIKEEELGPDDYPQN